MNDAYSHNGQEHAGEEVEIVPDEEGAHPDLQMRIKKLKEELGQCRKERGEYLDGWQRAKADFINYKKDEATHLEDIARFVTGGLLADLLPVLDSFDLALREKHTAGGGEEANSREQGMFLVYLQFMDVLKKRGVAPLEVKKGDQFDPEKHESVGETESDAPVGTIADMVQKGYMLRDRVVRPARVRLAKQPT